ncbi:MAG: RNA degradosome polyphosphate kinase [Candidatus Dormibacteria bacterium]
MRLPSRSGSDTPPVRPGPRLAARVRAGRRQARSPKLLRPRAPDANPPVNVNLRYANRELSWLDFNARVMALAEDAEQPLLERAKFLAIVSQALDEFFQVRVAGLEEQIGAGVGTTTPPDGMTAHGQLAAIRERVLATVAGQQVIFAGSVAPALHAAGVSIVAISDLQPQDCEWLGRFFASRIFPVLTPLAVDPAHPFPYISNLSLNLAVTLRDPSEKGTRFARVKVPPLLPRFVALPDGDRFVPLEQVVGAHLSALFPGMDVVGAHPFRVTRNADLALEEDEADDLLAAIETELRRRRRFADVVRLEIDDTMPDKVLRLLMRELDIAPEAVYVIDGLLDLGSLWALHALDRPQLKDEPWLGATPAELVSSTEHDLPDVFRALRKGDVLVHHPYDSFAVSVEGFIEQAAGDQNVLAIKQTLYRTVGPEGGIMRALIRAAEQGKQVVALVELKARFDEQANIAWARALEEAGVHVVYGLVGLKTHAKVALVVRQEEGAIRNYVHLGTGNYNPKTATIYEDVGLLSADPAIGADVAELFNHLTGHSRQRHWRRLLVAPAGLRTAILDLIRREAKLRDGRIILKMNSLVDEEIIEALYEASGAGVRIDLIVRGICCLRPGVPNQSENIRVRSLVGRFLEHSRILRFGSDARDPEYYIGSADLMPRNLDRRVEAMVPVSDPALRARLAEILDAALRDDVLAWELGPDATWSKVPTVRGDQTQQWLQAGALRRSQTTAPTAVV